MTTSVITREMAYKFWRDLSEMASENANFLSGAFGESKPMREFLSAGGTEKEWEHGMREAMDIEECVKRICHDAEAALAGKYDVESDCEVVSERDSDNEVPVSRHTKAMERQMSHVEVQHEYCPTAPPIRQQKPSKWTPPAEEEW